MGAHWAAYVYTSSLCFYSNLLSTKDKSFTTEGAKDAEGKRNEEIRGDSFPPFFLSILKFSVFSVSSVVRSSPYLS